MMKDIRLATSISTAIVVAVSLVYLTANWRFDYLSYLLMALFCVSSICCFIAFVGPKIVERIVRQQLARDRVLHSQCGQENRGGQNGED